LKQRKSSAVNFVRLGRGRVVVYLSVQRGVKDVVGLEGTTELDREDGRQEFPGIL
jgi:hypothetical protein